MSSGAVFGIALPQAIALLLALAVLLGSARMLWRWRSPSATAQPQAWRAAFLLLAQAASADTINTNTPRIQIRIPTTPRCMEARILPFGDGHVARAGPHGVAAFGQHDRCHQLCGSAAGGA